MGVVWNTPVEPSVKSAFELTANFKQHSRKIECSCGFVDVHLDEEHKRIERAQGSTQEQQQQVEEKRLRRRSRKKRAVKTIPIYHVTRLQRTTKNQVALLVSICYIARY